MFFRDAAYADGDGEITPDPTPAWWRPSPSLEELKALKAEGPAPQIKPDPVPCRLPDNRRYRREHACGRNALNRAVLRGFYLPWRGAWPPVWRWDIVPFLRMRRAHSAQAMRWAADVAVVVISTGDEQWTVTLPSAGEGRLSRGDRRGHHKNRRALIRARINRTHRERQAAASCLALLSRRHVRIQPTNAP
jgi:hypothetical protein